MRKTPKPFEGKLHIKTGDTVILLAGKDKGKTGMVSRVYPKSGKAVVDGLNIVIKHQKGQPTAANPNPESGRVEAAAPIPVSKLSLIGSDGKPTRIRIQTTEDGKKQRVAIKGGQVFAEPAKA